MVSPKRLFFLRILLAAAHARNQTLDIFPTWPLTEVAQTNGVERLRSLRTRPAHHFRAGMRDNGPLLIG